MNNRLVVVLFVMFAFAFKASQVFSLEFPDHFPEPHYDFDNNPLSTETIDLGRALFYDPLLSIDNTISCASCHSSYNSFAHTDHDLSHGIHDSIGIRNAPSLINLAWSTSFMWDGAHRHLDMQALAPIQAASEMGQDLEGLIEKLNTSQLYRKLFAQAYNDSIATTEKMLKALSQFQLTLISADSKYDQVMNGTAQYSIQEKKGYELFKQHCASCHAEPLFTNHSFQNNGLPMDSLLSDKGRMSVTHVSEDSLKFKVPTLRNLEYSYPYMHDGRFHSISEVLKHYTEGIESSHTLAVQLKDRVVLSSADKVDLTTFILCLNDEAFVFNKNHQFPKEIFFPTTEEH